MSPGILENRMLTSELSTAVDNVTPDERVKQP